MKRLSIVALVWIISSAIEAFALPVTVRERGTRSPLRKVPVFILFGENGRQRLETDLNGQIEVSDERLHDSSSRIVINLANYLRFEKRLDASPVIYIERDPEATVLETTIKDKKRDSFSQRRVSQQEFLMAPGANADPVRALQNLAGVNRVQGLASQIVIQGAGPQDTSYLIDQHKVPIIFHFGGISSVVSPFAVEDVDLLAAGYGAQYGRANGGLVNLTVRKARRDRIHGLGFIDLLNAGALAEGPIGDQGGWLISGRQSYIGSVLKAVFKKNENFDLTVAPSYRDFTLGVDYDYSPKDQVRLTGVYSRDELTFLFKQPLKADPSIRGSFDNVTQFWRLIPQWTHRHSDSSVSKFSLGMGQDQVKVDAGENRFDLDVLALTTRFEHERALSERVQQRLGFDHSYAWADLQIALPDTFSAGGVSNPLSSGERRTASISAEDHNLGLYSITEIKTTSRLSLFPQLRLDRYVRTSELIVQPRGAVSYALSSSVSLRASGGLYSQPAQPQESDPYFGNPNIRAPRSLQISAGTGLDFREGGARGWTADLDVFGRRFDRLVIPSSRFTTQNGALTPENFNNDGRGYAVGLQTEGKWSDDRFSARVIYTLSQSRRYQPSQGWTRAQYDQTHMLGLIGSYQMRRWTFSGRFRYATGNPITPVKDAVFDSDSDVYIPIRGAFYSDRLPDFYQLDLRVDRKWTFDKWILSVYLDIQNVTNRKNPEGVVYAFDYSQRKTISGLPILPLLGVKGEF